MQDSHTLPRCIGNATPTGAPSLAPTHLAARCSRRTTGRSSQSRCCPRSGRGSASRGDGRPGQAQCVRACASAVHPGQVQVEWAKAPGGDGKAVRGGWVAPYEHRTSKGRTLTHLTQTPAPATSHRPTCRLKLMPSVPMLMPSDTPMVLNLWGCPAKAGAREACSVMAAFIHAGLRWW